MFSQSGKGAWIRKNRVPYEGRDLSHRRRLNSVSNDGILKYLLDDSLRVKREEVTASSLKYRANDAASPTITDILPLTGSKLN